MPKKYEFTLVELCVLREALIEYSHRIYPPRRRKRQSETELPDGASACRPVCCRYPVVEVISDLSSLSAPCRVRPDCESSGRGFFRRGERQHCGRNAGRTRVWLRLRLCVCLSYTGRFAYRRSRVSVPNVQPWLRPLRGHGVIHAPLCGRQPGVRYVPHAREEVAPLVAR